MVKLTGRKALRTILLLEKRRGNRDPDTRCERELAQALGEKCLPVLRLSRPAPPSPGAPLQAQALRKGCRVPRSDVPRTAAAKSPNGKEPACPPAEWVSKVQRTLHAQ